MASELVSLLILIISGGLFFLVALAISSLGTRLNPLPSTARNLNGNTGGNVEGNGDLEHDHDHGFAGRLSAEATLIGRSLQAAALMTAAIELHGRTMAQQREKRWFISLITALLAMSGTIIGAFIVAGSG